MCATNQKVMSVKYVDWPIPWINTYVFPYSAVCKGPHKTYAKECKQKFFRPDQTFKMTEGDTRTSKKAGDEADGGGGNRWGGIRQHL